MLRLNKPNLKDKHPQIGPKYYKVTSERPGKHSYVKTTVHNVFLLRILSFSHKSDDSCGFLLSLSFSWWRIPDGSVYCWHCAIVLDNWSIAISHRSLTATQDQCYQPCLVCTRKLAVMTTRRSSSTGMCEALFSDMIQQIEWHLPLGIVERLSVNTLIRIPFYCLCGGVRWSILQIK